MAQPTGGAINRMELGNLGFFWSRSPGNFDDTFLCFCCFYFSLNLGLGFLLDSFFFHVPDLEEVFCRAHCLGLEIPASNSSSDNKLLLRYLEMYFAVSQK